MTRRCTKTAGTMPRTQKEILRGIHGKYAYSIFNDLSYNFLLKMEKSSQPEGQTALKDVERQLFDVQIKQRDNVIAKLEHNSKVQKKHLIDATAKVVMLSQQINIKEKEIQVLAKANEST